MEQTRSVRFNRKLPFSILYPQVQFHAEQIRIRNGSGELLSFLKSISRWNALISVLLMKRYRRVFSHEEKESFEQDFRGIYASLSEKQKLHSLYVISLIMAALYLHDEDLIAAAIKSTSGNYNDRKRILLFSGQAREMLELRYFTNEDVADYLCYRNLYARKIEFMTEAEAFDRVLVLEDGIGEDLKEVFLNAISMKQYRYAGSLLNIFPQLNLISLDTDMSIMSGSSFYSDLSFLEYLYVGRELCIREAADPWQSFREWTDKVTEETASNETYAAILSYYVLLNRLVLGRDDPEETIRSYEYREIDPLIINTDLIKKQQFTAFEFLFRGRIDLAETFIASCGANNPYVYSLNSDMPKADRLTFEASRTAILKMAEAGFDKEKIVKIILNSPLRTSYPLFLALRELQEHGCAMPEDLSSVYPQPFVGRLLYDSKRKIHVIVPYSFRNDFTEIQLDDEEDRKDIIYSWTRNGNPVRFRLLHMKEDLESGFGIFFGRVIFEESGEDIVLTRQYVRNYSNRDLKKRLQQCETDLDRLILIMSMYARQRITFYQFLSNSTDLYKRIQLDFQDWLRINNAMINALGHLQNDPHNAHELIQMTVRLDFYMRSSHGLYEQDFLTLCSRMPYAKIRDLKRKFENFVSSPSGEKEFRAYYTNTFLKHVIPFDEAMRFYPDQEEPLRINVLLGGYVVDFRTIEDSSKELYVSVRHTPDPNRPLWIRVPRNKYFNEEKAQEHGYHYFSIQYYDFEKKEAGSNFVLVPSAEKQEKEKTS